jgi:CheY-like chemotaxis protein
MVYALGTSFERFSTEASGTEAYNYGKSGGGPLSSPDTYPVTCFSCRAPFEAFDSAWCNCLVTKRTLVCPSCLNCFCKAPPAWKQKFWEDAPPRLWERSTAEHSATIVLAPNPDPADIVRPMVLIVDDEPNIQQMAVRAVGSLGYGVVLARNGEEGLALAAAYKPEIVLTDAMMPKMDGREMCRQIKEQPATAGTKVIIMTSLYTAARYRSEAYKDFHADEYLSKPLDIQQLQAVLRKLLDRPGA